MRRFKQTSLALLCCLTILSLGGQPQSEAQLSSRFGKNKVHYKDFHWLTLKTPHFMIYFYQGEERLARNTEVIAERAYHYLSETLGHQFSKQIPLIIYASSDDFQQTEVIEGLIGEGLGGVTESLRGRIILPFQGSYQEFNHVLLHELVHAFQFDLLDEAGSGFSLLSSVSIPLWFVEGMAEYLSEPSNPLTDMWLADAVANDTLPSGKKIEGLEDIRVYRFGESLITYLVENYGQDQLGEILRYVGKTEDWEEALPKLAQSSWEEFYEKWRTSIKDRYSGESSQHQALERQATLLIPHKVDTFFLNILPAASPDGKYLALISDRDLYQTIYLASAETGEMLTPLVDGDWRGTYETLRYLYTSLAWAPDSQHLAFNAKAGGENAMYVLHVPSKKVIQQLTPDVTSLSFLTWSPDGTHIVFTGVKNGQEDLFLITLATQEIVQLTDDLYTNRQPAWSPDGAYIAFVTDAGPSSIPEKLQFGSSNLAIYDVATKATTLLTETAANEMSPVWSPDGAWLGFTSDQQGTYNLYLLQFLPQRAPEIARLTNAIVQVTNVNTGIVGLTSHTPSVTWASATGKLFFSGFSNRGWDIFVLDNPVQYYQDYLAEVGHDEGMNSGPIQATRPGVVGTKDWGAVTPAYEKVDVKPYHARLRPEYVFGGGGGTDDYFFILAYVGFSDMLSNHRLQFGGTFTNVFDDAEFLLEYLNLSHRLKYSLAAFQVKEQLGAYTFEDGELELERERGVGLTFSWPFDKFRRLDLTLEGRMADGNFHLPKSNISVQRDDQTMFSPALAYVHDTTLYTVVGPLDGRRARFGIYPAVGDVTYVTLVADQRWYKHLTRRSALAGRVATSGSFGENARIFAIGGQSLFRGRSFDDDDELRGRKVALGNLEYRFPLLPKINFLRGNVFLDSALVWNDTLQPFTTRNTDGLRLHDLHAAYGFGLRVPIQSPFGALNIRFDVAWETDLTQTLGKQKYFFSIGNDF